MAVVNHPNPPHNFRDGEGNVDWDASAEDVEPDPYYADDLNVNFRGASGPMKVAEASDKAWARHIATALTYWAEQ